MNRIILWILRILAALIMLQTLFYKFSAAEEPVYIFSTLGMEPWGRIGTGIGELIASLLILYPRTTGIGSLMGIGLMLGAIYFHLTKLGIVVHVNNAPEGDGGQLFIYGCIVLVCCIVLAYVHRNQFLNLLKRKTVTA